MAVRTATAEKNDSLESQKSGEDDDARLSVHNISEYEDMELNDFLVIMDAGMAAVTLAIAVKGLKSGQCEE